MNVGVFILGIILVIGGIVLYGYTRTPTDEGLFFAPPESDYSRPYGFVGVVILIIGLVFMVVGAVSPTVVTKTMTKTDEIVHPRKRVTVREEHE